MEPALVPDFPNWVITALQNKPKSFLLLVYDETGKKKLLGCILADSITTLKLQDNFSFRLFRYQSCSDEPTTCVFCQVEKREGFTFQQDLESFICSGCALGH